MAHRAFIGKIKSGKVEEYVDAHRAVWPELLAVMKELGVKRESCFVRGPYIFVYVEAEDIDTVLDRVHQQPITQKWDAYMATILEPPVEGTPELFPRMTEVFALG